MMEILHFGYNIGLEAMIYIIYLFIYYYYYYFKILNYFPSQTEKKMVFSRLQKVPWKVAQV